MNTIWYLSLIFCQEYEAVAGGHHGPAQCAPPILIKHEFHTEQACKESGTKTINPWFDTFKCITIIVKDDETLK